MRNLFEHPLLGRTHSSIFWGALRAAATVCPPRPEAPDLVTRRSLAPSTPSHPIPDTDRLAHVRLP